MRKKNILLVDDDRVANFLSEKIIAAMGIAEEVFSVTNGREALNVLSQSHTDQKALPDVIILDLNMPIMDGFEFIRAFQKLNIPQKEQMIIIVVTSSNNPEDIERAKSYGIKHYLTKPISLESVKSIIQENSNL